MRTIYFCLLLFLVTGCASKKLVDASALHTMVLAKEFSVISDVAHPSASASLNKLQNSGLLGVGNSGSSINLIGNSNFLIVKGDSITSYLPYFGERHMGGGYSGDDIAVQFDGVAQNYEAIWNTKKLVYNISFSAQSKGESFDVRIQLYPNLNSYMTILGTKRSSISYNGKVAAVQEKEQ